MSKLIFSLKQHTPMIHFQWDQLGATIRASDLKPRLDKFLIKQLFKCEDDFENYKYYLIGYDEKRHNMMNKEYFKDRWAFNYKIKISPRGKKQITLIGNNNLYLGGIGSKNDYKNERTKCKFIKCENVEIEIFSFYTQLLGYIIKILPSFFMHNNFGTRQSKGFGSFTVNDEYSLDGCKHKFINTNSFKYHLKNPVTDDKETFEQIYKFYKKIRSDSNSYIKRFFVSKGMEWEKDAIRSKLNGEKSSTDNTYIIKDLLGFSPSENWREQGVTVKKINVNASQEDTIERMESPIFFKPIKDDSGKITIYFEAKEIKKEFLNKIFEIRRDNEGIMKLKTPTEFDIDEFLEFVKENDNTVEIN